MQDLQIIAYEGIAPLRSADLQVEDVPYLDIQGEGFDTVTAVLINGMASPTYAVLSATRLIAELPFDLRYDLINRIEVRLSRTDLVEETGVRLDLTSGAAPAEGLVRLVQSFIKHLLTTPGRDIFMPESGGGLLALAGTSLPETTLRSEIALCVSRTTEQLIGFQARAGGQLPREERLVSATLLSLEIDRAQARASVRVRLVNAANQPAEAGVTI